MVTPHKLQGYGVSVRINREIGAYQKLSIPVTVLSTVESGSINDCEIICISGSMQRLSSLLGFDRIANSKKIVRNVFSKGRINSFIKGMGLKVAKVADKRNLNILHCDDFVGSLISLEAKKHMKKEPLVIGEFADLIHLDFKERFSLEDKDTLVSDTQELLTNVFDTLDFSFFVSPIDKEIAINELGVSSKKTELVYEAADKEAPYNAIYKKEPTDVCYMSSLANWENPYLLANSYRFAASHIKNLHYLVLGAGPLFKKTQKIVKDVAGVSFYGFRPYREAIQIASTTDLGIISTIKKRAMPSKLFVYASLGLPIISMDGMWWSNDFIKHYDIGYVSNSTPEDLGDVIQSALQKPQELEQKGRRAKKMVVNEFNWDSRTKKMLSIYETLID